MVVGFLFFANYVCVDSFNRDFKSKMAKPKNMPEVLVNALTYYFYLLMTRIDNPKSMADKPRYCNVNLLILVVLMAFRDGF